MIKKLAVVVRGGRPELEMEHAQLLLDGGEKEIWGWGTPVGRQRVQNRVRWIIESCDLKPGVQVLVQFG
jgi:hypothetical protein